MRSDQVPGPKGAHTYIDRGEYLNLVAKKYGRDPTGLCLKICYKFFPKPGKKLEEIKWCGSPLPVLDCTRLQNICHWRGLAPRVYAVDVIDWKGQRAVAQLQDYAGEGEGRNPSLFKHVCKVIEEYGGFHMFSKGDGGTWNSAGGKWVGFKGAGWKDKTIYHQKIKKIISMGSNKIIENANVCMELANYLGYFNWDHDGLKAFMVESMITEARKILDKT